jgi:2-polyprenyl-3-methyl-5-hydroxy-6-metoxy-1,4-benzoquinol methylase
MFYKKAKTVNKQDEIVRQTKGKVVLDVGCVGQDLTYTNLNWLHFKIKQVAAQLVGCDINEEGLSKIQELDYDACLPEQLSEKNQLFDVIVMGDVIEHVNDPGAFVKFYYSFLKSDGKMIICTPNAFGFRYHLQVFFYGSPSSNPEHSLIFDPLTLAELCRRENLEISEFYWLKELTPAKNFQQKVIRFISSIFIYFRRYYSSNFMFVLKKI